jgi:hypothetical protein
MFDESIHLRQVHHSAPVDSSTGRHRSYQYRPLAKDLTNHYHHPTTLDQTSETRQPTIGTNLSRSQSREDISK